MARQLLFPGFEKLKVKDFGGSLIKGNAREPRPISVQRPIHLVMRSSLATGELSFLRARRPRLIHELVHRLGRAHGVKIYRFANSGNHLHFIIRPVSRKAFLRFIRAITGLIARITLGVERGRAKNLKFWDARPFTRILEWGKDYRTSANYVLQNQLEALGFIPFQPRGARRMSSTAPP